MRSPGRVKHALMQPISPLLDLADNADARPSTGLLLRVVHNERDVATSGSAAEDSASSVTPLVSIPSSHTANAATPNDIAPSVNTPPWPNVGSTTPTA